jgi:CxxC-x17-CxxC domain-containing protein
MLWHQDYSGDDSEKNNKNKTSRKEEGFASKCSSCGVDIIVPFKPDGLRPTYCKDCLNNPDKRKAPVVNKSIKSNFKKNNFSNNSLNKEKTSSTFKSNSFSKPSSKIVPNKNIKKEKIETAEEIIEDIKALSLDDLKQAKPVGFRSPKKNGIENDVKKDSSGEMKEGQNINLEN